MLAWLVMSLIAIALSLALGDRMRRGVFDSWQSAKPRDLTATDVRVVLKMKGVYELLESVTDRCKDVAKILEAIVLENS